LGKLDGKLRFEGEYLNDLKWNGKGYDSNNNIIYELKDGKGFVKEYSNNDKLIFEGEYKNGKRNGKGKEYNLFYDTILFEGEYINGEKNGKGKEYYDNGKLYFEGEYLYDFKIKGKLFINEKLEYEGEFRYDKKWTGKGFDENGNIIYELINGYGKVKEYCELNGELIFEGEYFNGKRNGKGKEYGKHYDNLKFEGEYFKGKRSGHGKEYSLVGKLIFEGEYLNDERNGREKEYNYDGKLIFEGEYINGKKLNK